MNRRALTLVEVLAATVLLALLAGTCVPFLQGATRALRSADAGIPVFDLAALADALIAQPDVFGLDDLEALDEAEIEWPDAVDLGPVRPPGPITVCRLTAPPDLDPESGTRPRPHAWLVVTCKGASVYRWLPPNEPQPDADPADADAGNARNAAPREPDP